MSTTEERSLSDPSEQTDVRARGRATTSGQVPRLLFDDEDIELLEVVNRIISQRQRADLLRRLFDPYLHARGIKELAAPKAVRIAHAIVDLLETLEVGHREERIRALRAVRDEALHNGSQSLRLNVARVLLQTMKRLVRAHGDTLSQLELAHDFRDAVTGNPWRVREQLEKYHLVEMPEDWSQLGVDHHVHDAHSKGRKSPTHLIMDAWIKGIRFLTVVYYNYVPPEAATELLEAAEIMGVSVRIGVELAAVHRDKYVNLVWVPRGFHGRRDFVEFLKDPAVREFMDEGRAVAKHHECHVLQLLDSFNAHHLPKLNEQYGVAIEPLAQAKLLEYVGVGQTSILHLAEFIHSELVPHFRLRAKDLGRGCAEGEGRRQACALVESMQQLDSEAIAERYLTPAANPDVPDITKPCETPEIPALLKLSPAEMIAKLSTLPSGFRITLNPSNLTAEDVLEVLYDGDGKITHIEIFNLKDWAEGHVEHRLEIDRIRRTLNSGNVIAAKRLVLEMLQRVEGTEEAEEAGRAGKLRRILSDIPRLLGFYQHMRLKSRIGSDSTGRSRHWRGMGLIVLPTLPRRARARVYRGRSRRVPVRTIANLRVTHIPRRGEDRVSDAVYRALRRTPGLHPFGYVRVREWAVASNATHIDPDGNIASLGGLAEETDFGVSLATDDERGRSRPRMSWRYLDTRVKNTVKVLLGFVPAFVTFFLTKDWWPIQYLGAVIWFAITGGRNIVQSVVGAGGLSRSSLLKWNDFVSWNRVADSLFFTGFSVPLLDLLVKTLLLDRALGITTSTNPLALYAGMAVANGTYLFSHNVARGLQPAAAAGNLFRTVLSIPIAYGINVGLAGLLVVSGVSEVAVLAGLQLWAAVISKFSSDVVAALIEGAADRQEYLARREDDYRDKLRQLYDAYGRLEMMFPERNVLELLEQPRKFVRAVGPDGHDLVRQVIVNALDLLYFWAYQPMATTVLRHIVESSSDEERKILLHSQRVLERKRVISEMVLNGLVGPRFDRALAFYLSRADAYMRWLGKLVRNGRRSRPRRNGEAVGAGATVT